MSWWSDFQQDMKRYDGSPLRHQGLWATFQYRIAHAVYERNPQSAWLPLLYAWRKLVEILSGMSLPHAARLGPGLLLGHCGPVVVNKLTTCGEGCTLMQGVTLGGRFRGETRGAPMLGDRVFVGANAVVIGPVTIGDGARIGALSYVDRDVPADGVVHGHVDD
jgi:serine O-acetyltransferase